MAGIHDDAIFFRLPGELGERFRAKCQADGLEQSVVLRALVSKWVRGEIMRNGERLEIVRLCQVCHWPLTVKDEQAGNCPGCGAFVLSLRY